MKAQATDPVLGGPDRTPECDVWLFGSPKMYVDFVQPRRKREGGMKYLMNGKIRAVI